MRAVLVMAPVTLSCGTLKSTRMRTRLPESERSRMVLNLDMDKKLTAKFAKIREEVDDFACLRALRG